MNSYGANGTKKYYCGNTYGEYTVIGPYCYDTGNWMRTYTYWTSMFSCHEYCRAGGYCEYYHSGYVWFKNRFAASSTYEYSCPNGGTLLGSSCILGTYNGNKKSNACSNYCSEGTFYNGKCYKLN